jgi:hypothetical protein
VEGRVSGLHVGKGPLMWSLALPGILICIFSLVYGQGRCCFGFIVHSGFGRDIVKVFGPH